MGLQVEIIDLLRVVRSAWIEDRIHVRRICAGTIQLERVNATDATAPSITASTMLLVARTGIDFLEPWCEFVPDQSDAFLRELKSEFAPDHPLYGLQLHPLGHSGLSDDAIFEADDGRIFQVHLTFSGGAEKTPSPRFRTYSNTAEWIQTVMLPADGRFDGGHFKLRQRRID